MYLPRKIVNKQGDAGSQKNNSRLRLYMWLFNYSRWFNAFRQCVYSTGNALQHSSWMGILYRNKSFHPERLCVYRGQPGAAIDQVFKKIYKSVLPLCENCKSNAKSILKRGGLLTALANRARGKQQMQKK